MHSSPFIETGNVLSSSEKVSIERLQQLIIEQGARVRGLKASKAEKEHVDIEVKKLLDLKKQLAIANGQDVSAATDKKSKKFTLKTPKVFYSIQFNSRFNREQKIIMTKKWLFEIISSQQL